MIIVLLIIALYYRYDNYLFYRPQSIHAWRQADCASITLNYYQHGMNFFQPEVHNLTSDGGKTGYCATSEIPILYFFSAFLYKLFGPHEFIIRLINAIIFFLGLFCLSKLLLLVYKDYFWAIGLSILFFTSPVLVYYGNNYLTNVSALSLALIGWYYFFHYQQEKHQRLLFFALVFFFLAGTFKVTALMSLFALTGYYLFENLNFFCKNKPKVYLNNRLFVIGVFSIVLIIGVWVFFAGYYNKCHDCFYFSTTVFPIWSLSISEIKELVNHVYTYWISDYFHPLVFILFLFLILYIAFRYKKASRVHLIILLLLIIQSVFYIVLQFWTFYDHDYYTIEQNIVPVFIIITAYAVLVKTNQPLIDSVILKVLFSVFLLINIHHAKTKLSERYTGWKNSYYKERKEIYRITPYLREIGINPSDKIVYIPDGSNVSLYLMNQQGWTQYTDSRFNREVPITYNRDSSEISESVSRGAKYFIVNNAAEIYLHPYIQSFTRHLLGQFGNVLIFDFTDTVRNYRINLPILKDSISCDAEILVNERFQTSSAEITFGNGNTQSREQAYNGICSTKLNSGNPYGMTFIANNLKYGECIVVEVWRKGSDKGGIIAGGSAGTDFYRSSYNRVDIDSSKGWDKLRLKFFIPQNMEGKEIKIYMYNTSQQPAYFDDLVILRYRSIF
jgi:hypothetical protein